MGALALFAISETLSWPRRLRDKERLTDYSLTLSNSKRRKLYQKKPLPSRLLAGGIANVHASVQRQDNTNVAVKRRTCTSYAVTVDEEAFFLGHRAFQVLDILISLILWHDD